MLPPITPTMPTTADWQRVRRARFDVRHHYRYAYRAPISHLRQRLMMTPPDEHAGQVLLDHTLEVSGTGGAHTVAWETDPFGNRVAWVTVPRVTDAVTFESAYRVERTARCAGAAGGAPPTPPRPDVFLAPTALTAPDERITAAAQQIRASGDGCAERVADLAHDWAARAITYQVGVTGLQTPAAMALHLGRGVCQDYAHLLLSVLRLLGIPARYVSGHLLGEGVPHAWVEAFVRRPHAAAGACETIAYDPTHHRRAGLQYLTVAVGRDFADVSPTSGTFTGAAVGTMTWGKRAALVDLDYVA